jgi:hypothetical protein
MILKVNSVWNENCHCCNEPIPDEIIDKIETKTDEQTNENFTSTNEVNGYLEIYINSIDDGDFFYVCPKCSTNPTIKKITKLSEQYRIISKQLGTLLDKTDWVNKRIAKHSKKEIQ